MTGKIQRKHWVWPLAGLALQAGMAGAAELPELGEEQPSLAEELQSGFYSRINILAYTVIQEPEDSTINVDNAAEIPRYQAVLNPRADFILNFRQWEFGLKPRAEFIWEKWEDGRRKGDSNDSSELFLNEGWVRYRPIDELLISYGRENLQWGPSVILSSSNPFTRDNGRNNPRVEVPGRDYARALWIPNENWSLSAIANTGEGRADDVETYASGRLLPPGSPLLPDEEFERAYALKLDYTGSSSYFSLIPSYRESDQYKLGFFGGWNANDATLLYIEGNYEDEGKTDYQIGAAYTLEAGPTINLEYLRNNNGCDDEPMAECFLTGQVSFEDVLYRQNYAMIQYTDNTSVRDLNINLRLLRNLDDESNRLIGIFEYDVNNNVQLYLIGNLFSGGDDDEFGSLLSYSVFTGVGYTF